MGFGLRSHKMSLGPHRETDWSRIMRSTVQKFSHFDHLCSQNLQTIYVELVKRRLQYYMLPAVSHQSPTIAKTFWLMYNSLSTSCLSHLLQMPAKSTRNSTQLTLVKCLFEIYIANKYIIVVF